MSDYDRIVEARRRVREADEELAVLREDGPDGIDERAREVWAASIRDLEEERDAALRILACYPSIDD